MMSETCDENIINIYKTVQTGKTLESKTAHGLHTDDKEMDLSCFQTNFQLA